MSRTNISKRREVRALEAKRDDLITKKNRAVNDLAQVRAALKKRRTQA